MNGPMLAKMLAAAPTGLSFIYAALDALVQAYQLQDATVVVDSPLGDRQVFRQGRRGVGRISDRAGRPSPLLNADAGLRTEPPIVPSDVAAMVTDLCEVAFRLDLLDHDASHDALTGLYNRRTYEFSLDQAVSRTERYGWPFGLVLLDIDDFKMINDRHGHAAGDEVLRAVGSGLRASLRSGDVAARLGGDEFALLVLNADDRSVLEPITRRLRAALDRVIPEADIHFSTGVAFFPDDTPDGGVASLSRLADERLYEDKARPRSGSTRSPRSRLDPPAEQRHETPTNG
jgi:diguanylate cyclase (GGDEF)-like protein